MVSSAPHVHGAQHHASLHGLTAFVPGRSLDESRDALQQVFTAVRELHPQRIFRSPAPKNIGVLSLSGMGGSGKVARDYAQMMAEAGHRVFLFSANRTFFPKNDMPDVSVLHASVPMEPRAPEPSWVSQLSDELIASADARNLDVIHVHYVVGLLDAALLAKQRLEREGRQLRVIATLHGSDVTSFGKRPEYRPYIAQHLDKSDAVTAVSWWLAAEAQRTFSLGEVPAVVSNSIDATRFHPFQWSDLRQRIAPDGESVLCHVSNFRPVKRAVDTVEIHARLLQEGIASKLLLIGSGSEKVHVDERARALGTSRDVISVGAVQQDQLAAYVAASDIALVTSSSESFSLAALEAMACGVPVIGTRCGGLEEVLAHVDSSADGASRLLAGVGDVSSMAKLCAHLLRDPRTYWSTQVDGMITALTYFHSNHQRQGYLKVLERV